MVCAALVTAMVLCALCVPVFMYQPAFGHGRVFRARQLDSKRLAMTESDLMETSLGAPYDKRDSGEYKSLGGIDVSYQVENVDDPQGELNRLVSALDDSKGVLLRSSYEYPGRYARWTVGFVAPALQIEGSGLGFKISALNERGNKMVPIIKEYLQTFTALFQLNVASDDEYSISGSVIESDTYFSEEERSKQPSLFSLVRTVRDLFASPEAGQLGLYGALGYDLTFQFEPIEHAKEREADQRDLVMYLPDEIYIIDNQKRDAWKIKYDFTGRLQSGEELSTVSIPRTPAISRYEPAAADAVFEERDSAPGEYANKVGLAKEEFRVGNLFEVVLSQIFRSRMVDKPSNVFRRLCERNPSPYGFFINLGRNEYLVGASPEMFVRVEATKLGMRVETCPISGTIQRGSDPLEDAQQVKKLLFSTKEESELTMCTDVDRNDKSRICVPGSVKVLGRRQIEMYSRLIHTVDHVEGYLRENFDALDAFLCHTWAVTVTGAPKTWAIRFLEKTEPSVRHWYGGAVGIIGFDGSLNTGLTLRTTRIKDGIAEVRAGATLLHDSEPMAEEKETELKASALIDAIIRVGGPESASIPMVKDTVGEASPSSSGQRVLLIDHEDSFVHTLANYLRQTGAEVVTCRSGRSLQQFVAEKIDTGEFTPTLAVLSPGPGSPSDFKLSQTIDTMIDRRVPIFGVCLGLQGLVEHFGGKLGVLPTPMHGKPSVVARCGSGSADAFSALTPSDVLSDLPEEFQVARYHSLFGFEDTMHKDLLVTAKTEDDVVMAIQHATMPIAAVQFHPESILTLPKFGMKILTNALNLLKSEDYPK